MKILITGINGFVGNKLYKFLLEKGYCEISGIDINSDADNITALNITDREAVHDAVLSIKPDFIFHLAAIARVDVNDLQNIFDVNVNGTLNLLTACLKPGVKPGFLFVSSSQVYGFVQKSSQPINEDYPLRPVNSYGASKAAAENIAMSFYHEFGLPLVIARPFNHTGRGQSTDFVIPKLVEAFKQNQKEVKLGNTEVYRDYLDVRDVVSAYYSIMKDFRPGEIYNISSDIAIRIFDIVSMLREITGHNPDIVNDKAFIRKNDIPFIKGNSSKIRDNLGWEPVYDTMHTLRWMLEDYD